MALSDEKVLEGLLRTWEGQQKAKRRVRIQTEAAPAYNAPSYKSMRRQCNCGQCYKCKENARWERIFQAKFADPDYYVRRSIPHGSPLSD